MRFFDILDDLKNEYKNNCSIRNNGTILLCPGKIPRSRHMLFKPLCDEYIQEYLIEQYKNNFPEEYIEFLKYSNGANLHTVKLKTDRFEFAANLFVIFGLPLTPPFSRPKDEEEPFDVRIEDLGRHKDIPNTWLKCGTYTRNYNFNVQNDIFIDTETNKIYACIKNEKEIIDCWESLDECFCSIFESFTDSKLEYEFKSSR